MRGPHRTTDGTEADRGGSCGWRSLFKRGVRQSYHPHLPSHALASLETVTLARQGDLVGYDVSQSMTTAHPSVDRAGRRRSSTPVSPTSMTSVTASSSAAEVQLQLDTQPGTRWTMSDEEGQGHDEGAVAVDGRAGSLKDDAPPSPPIYPPPHTDQEATQGLEGRRRVLRHDGPGDTELPPPLSSSGSSSYASSTMRPSYTPTPTPHTTTHRRTRDFYLLPIPEWRQFREDKPFVFSPFINYLFAFVSTAAETTLRQCSASTQVVHMMPTHDAHVQAGSLIFFHRLTRPRLSPSPIYTTASPSSSSSPNLLVFRE